MTVPYSDVQPLATLNELNLKAFSSKSQKALIFLILNDTISLVKYDRALLWDMSGMKPKLLGVSGQTTFSKDSSLFMQMQSLISDIENPEQIQVLKEKVKKKEAPSAILWVPIIFEGELLCGLWLERWHDPTWHPDKISLLTHLARGYGIAWQKFVKRKIPKLTRSGYWISSFIMFVILFLVPVRLRVVAPCEIVPKDPYLIAAPLNGIIEEIVVKPGQEVKEEELLFVYDKRVPLQELKVAQKQVDIAQSQLTRIMTLGIRDPKALEETAVWQLQLQKEQIKLDLAEYQASQLEVKAPVAGFASFENPDEWRGRPVQIGERVMLLTDPKSTKLKIWLAESDNIPLYREKPIKVFLNIDPSTSYPASLIYISEYTTISEKGVPSFIAEADWIEEPEEVKIGVKGTAVLYGYRVTGFYWLFRRPWYALRDLIGF